MPMKAHSKPVLPMLFGIVLTVVLLLAGSVAFGGGKPAPAPTYSWSAIIPVSEYYSLQGVGVAENPPNSIVLPNGDTVLGYEVITSRNLVWTVNKTYSVFRFEVADESPMKVSLGSPYGTCSSGDCSLLQAEWEANQPDLTYAKRILVAIASPGGYLFDQQPVDTTFQCSAGVLSVTIDTETDIQLAMKNYVGGGNNNSTDPSYNYPLSLRITRLNDNVWHLTGNTDGMNLAEHQSIAEQQCNPKRTNCQDVIVTKRVATALGNGISFDLYFVRVQTN
jgi:hypothetical protein